MHLITNVIARALLNREYIFNICLALRTEVKVFILLDKKKYFID